MTSLELGKALAQLGTGIGRVNATICDSEYALPSRAWIAGPFADSLKRNLETLGLSSYAAERWDCDKFALLATALAKMDHALTTTAEKGLAFGHIAYLKRIPDSLPGGHAINIAVVWEGGGPVILFFEPQTFKLVELSESERESIWMYYL